ncbi:MAG: tetratricopeptide repeat protein [Syntrophales bacterium]|nr:tetratricopeptide repeat protein [Syntrophales bacterium]MDY0043092.1 tetratricopeptide repeat protein [Syntrophales bacterium]
MAAAFIVCSGARGEFPERETKSYGIHIASFKNRAFAERNVHSLEKSGCTAFLLSVSIPGKGQWYRVFAGMSDKKGRALERAAALKEKGVISEYFIRTIAVNIARESQMDQKIEEKIEKPSIVQPKPMEEEEVELFSSNSTVGKNTKPENVPFGSITPLKEKEGGKIKYDEIEEPISKKNLSYNTKTGKKGALPLAEPEHAHLQSRQEKSNHMISCRPEPGEESIPREIRKDFDEAMTEFNRGNYKTARAGFIELKERPGLGKKAQEVLERRCADCRFYSGMAGARSELLASLEEYDSISRRYPQSEGLNDEILFRKAQAYDTLKLHYEALRELSKILEKYPDSKYQPEVHYLIGLTYYSLGKYTSAAENLKTYATLYPEGSRLPSAFFYIGECYSQENRFAQADKWYDMALKLYSSADKMPPDMLLKLTFHYFRSGRFDETLEIALVFLNLYPESSRAKEEMFMAAQSVMKMKCLPLAIKMFGQVVARYPGSDEAWKSMLFMAEIGVENNFAVPGNILHAMEYYLDPLSAYEKAFDEYSGISGEELSYRKAAVLMRYKNYRNAFDVYNRLLESNPWSSYRKIYLEKIIECASILIDRYWEKQDYLAVSDLYFTTRQYGIALHMEFSDLFHMGASLCRIGLTEWGRKIFNEMECCYADESRQREIILALAKIDLSEGKLEEALGRLKTYTANYSGSQNADEVSVKELMGHIFLKKGEYGKAIVYYADIINSNEDPGFKMTIQKYIADCFMGMGLFDSAVACYLKSLNLAEKTAGEISSLILNEASERIAKCYYNEKAYEKSTESYRKFLEEHRRKEDPKNLWALYRMGLGYVQLSDTVMADKTFALLREEGEEYFWDRLTEFSEDFQNWHTSYGEYIH